MRNETVRGVTLSYHESGAGPSVVFVHGFPLDARMWEQQIAYFSRRFRVIAPDLRGFGRSASVEPFSMVSLADDIQALLAKTTALPCVLCGLSMGGYVALAFAKKYPGDLRGLVLVDTRAEADSAEGKANRNRMIELVRTAGSKAVSGQMLPSLLSQKTLQSHPHIVEKIRQMTECCPPRTIENALIALRDREDQTCSIASIAVPTLILVGEHDQITPPDLSHAMHSTIPRSILEIIADAGHMAPLENPEEFNPRLERFLDWVG